MWTSLHSRTMQDSAVKPCSVKCGMGGAEGCHNTGELTHLGERDSYPYKRGLDRKVGAPSCDKVPLLSQHPFVANFLPFPTNWHPLSHLSEYNLVQLCGDFTYHFLIIFNSGDPGTYAGGGGRGGHTTQVVYYFFNISNILFLILNSGDPWTYAAGGGHRSCPILCKSNNGHRVQMQKCIPLVIQTHTSYCFVETIYTYVCLCFFLVYHLLLFLLHASKNWKATAFEIGEVLHSCICI